MKKIIIFLCLSFVLTWLVWGLLSSYVLRANRGTSIIINQMVTIIVTLSMWIPGISVLITKALSRKNRIILRPVFRFHFKKHIRFYMTALFVPVAVIVIGAVIYFMVFPGQISINSGLFSQVIDDNPMLKKLPSNLRIMFPLVITVQVILTIVLGSLFNMIFTMGEELAWRGFLYPEFRKKFSGITAALLSGTIWGIWHAPVIAMGHNYSYGYLGYPWTGVAAMTLFCIFFGIFLSWLTERTESIWPAAIAHGTLNAGAGLPFLLMDNMLDGNRLLGPAVYGGLSGIPVIILGICCGIQLAKKPKAEKGIWESVPCN